MTTSKSVVKALVIYPSGELEYIDYDMVNGLEESTKYFEGYRSGIALCGGEYDGFALAMICNDIFDGLSSNKYASMLCTYLKSDYLVKPIEIKGIAILVDDNNDITEDVLKRLHGIIEAKMKKKMPIKLKEQNDMLTKKYKECKNPMLKSLLEISLNEAKYYGMTIN